MTATTSQELLAAADRVRAAATRSSRTPVRERTDLDEEPAGNPAQKSGPHRAPTDAAAGRAAWLATQRQTLEQHSDRLADL